MPLTLIASWPAPRAAHWATLLQARAIEKQAYVVGVNRCGRQMHRAALQDLDRPEQPLARGFEPDLDVAAVVGVPAAGDKPARLYHTCLLAMLIIPPFHASHFQATHHHPGEMRPLPRT